jgi:menaquinone-dependent protoporphyrinogen oxidase
MLPVDLEEREEPNMNGTVLVAYATKYGATKEIAEVIGQTLRAAGREAEVRAAEGVKDLSAYAAVILGSAVYIAQWRKEAVAFLETHEQALAERPVWLFSSGPTGSGDPVQLMSGWRFPDSEKPIAERIHARGLVLFHGMLDPKNLNLPEKLILKGIKAPLGDFRDWQAVRAWAQTVADTLKNEGI